MKRPDLVEYKAMDEVRRLRAQAEALEERAEWICVQVREGGWMQLARAGVLRREDLDGSMTIQPPEVPHAP